MREEWSRLIKKGKVLMMSFGFVTVALLGLLMPAKAAIYHSGAIMSNETWYAADNPHVVVGNVTVVQGVTLTIEAGAEVYFDTGKNIYVNGDIYAVGSSSSYILFTSNESTKDPGDWGTIQINSASPPISSEIGYSIIKYATTGITDARGIRMSYNFITDNTRGIYANDAMPTIEYNSIVNSTNNGIDWTQSIPYSIKGAVMYNTISDNGGKGVYLMQNAAPPIKGNTIESNGYGGIYSVKSCPDIDNNTISDNTYWGVYLEDYDSANITVRNNEITDNSAEGIYATRTKLRISDNNVSSNNRGIFLEYSPAKIENNTINSNTNYGIYVEKSNETIWNNDLINNGQWAVFYVFWKTTGPPGGDHTPFFQTAQDIQNNTVTSNAAASGVHIRNADLNIINNNSIAWFDSNSRFGIYLESSNGTITNNSIENNTYGIFAMYSDPVVRGNNIANNVLWGFYNDDPTIDIHALYNWWNDAGGPDDDSPRDGRQNDNDPGDDVSDWVDYDDWLTVPAF